MPGKVRPNSKDPRVDSYIDGSAPFARPILSHLREIVHETCPEVEETIKWKFPNFIYNGMLCSMAAFKEHASFGFWKGELVTGEKDLGAMGSFGKLTKLSDLPSDSTLKAYVRKAMQLNEARVRPKKTPKANKALLKVPKDLLKALAADKKAEANFDKFPPSHRREYAEWVEEAKRAETRAKRVAQAIEWIAKGKSRNWKYE